MQGMSLWLCCIKPSQPFRKIFHQPVGQLQLQTHLSKQGDKPNRALPHVVRKYTNSSPRKSPRRFTTSLKKNNNKRTFHGLKHFNLKTLKLGLNSDPFQVKVLLAFRKPWSKRRPQLSMPSLPGCLPPAQNHAETELHWTHPSPEPARSFKKFTIPTCRHWSDCTAVTDTIITTHLSAGMETPTSPGFGW